MFVWAASEPVYQVFYRIKLLSASDDNADSRLLPCPLLDIENAVVRMGDNPIGVIGDWMKTDNIMAADYTSGMYDMMHEFHVVDQCRLGSPVKLGFEIGPVPAEVDDLIEEGQLRNEHIAQVRFVDICFHKHNY